MEAREEEDVQGDKHSRKIYRRCESAGVVFAEWLVIGVGGEVSSPNAPAGVGGSKSKSRYSKETYASAYTHTSNLNVHESDLLKLLQTYTAYIHTYTHACISKTDSITQTD